MFQSLKIPNVVRVNQWFCRFMCSRRYHVATTARAHLIIFSDWTLVKSNRGHPNWIRKSKGCWRIATQISLIATNPEAIVTALHRHRPPFFRNFPIIFASFWYHRRVYSSLHTETTRIRWYFIKRGAHAWERCASAPVASTQKWQLTTRPLAFLLVAVFTNVSLIVWEYKIGYTFIIFIRHRTAENNQRHLSQRFFL